MNPTADYMKYNFLLADEIIPGVTKDAYYSQSGKSDLTCLKAFKHKNCRPCDKKYLVNM
ncbi:hypothetical protein DPMN_087480 [Dreissena polymorpha]|uniref:Uncharacterized protein n=1 Tax=Dreissena polymorpha TaxID=45954 RepID=A0A9D4QWY0_DREPO|nr:hypothetical protein DPMN_087480 [Dreissena polymorpha]